tara:strand:- start:428 stop:1141 length:714 start_codon:yes stop_codon:yes gene_type:complete
MGLFGSKFELTEKQTKKLNTLLPESLRKDDFTKKDFDSLTGKMQTKIYDLEILINRAEKKLQKIKEEGNNKIAQKIKIFNCELHEAKPLGMVDVGGIHKFSGSTTGDRFAGGLVGYALEMAIDDVWTKSSKQEEAVNEVKLKLILKTLGIYPEANMLFNFDVDFREMGSTGSVFIYMRATAAIGKNSLIEVVKKENEKEIKEPVLSIEKLKLEKEFCEKNKPLLPTKKQQIEEKLGS